MVKILRKVIFLDDLKPIYHKPFWEKTALLWEKFKESNPALGLFAPLAAVVIPILGGLVFYKKLHENPYPKYYEYIMVLRPDDPRVQNIRKDESLKIGLLKEKDTILMRH
ncbi:uncharacterized protein LOC551318 [Apis mellifera]|uniref:Uncharacterized protein LOC551318 n=1 Tax=Apis mellifera TaxID=7460 RepID=A0A7M7RCA6_APIME|nr:uncharacterized protein LOC551318 [Apis mellifera]|eukprot:XP_625245.2 uncharacterized protein LOC551318 [Apis mellifera]